jgi:hypothetical protein
MLPAAQCFHNQQINEASCLVSGRRIHKNNIIDRLIIQFCQVKSFLKSVMGIQEAVFQSDFVSDRPSGGLVEHVT